MKSYLWMILLVSVTYMSCTSQSARQKPLEINTMKGIMWDLMKAGEWHLLIISKDSTARKRKEDIRLYQQVFALHGITKQRFYDSYKYYEAHPVEFKILIDSVDLFSNREKNRMFDSHGQAH